MITHHPAPILILILAVTIRKEKTNSTSGDLKMKNVIAEGKGFYYMQF